MAVKRVVAAALLVMAQGPLPDPVRTPGAVNPAVTQETIYSTICRSGWSASVRPPAAYTGALKRRQLRELGGIVVEIRRPGMVASNHVSDAGIKADAVIDNDGNMVDFCRKIGQFLSHYHFLKNSSAE